VPGELEAVFARVAAFLVSDGAVSLMGNIEYIDAGYHVLG
jgi:enoyl-[acyl-carrier protein] reductase I